MVSVQDIQRFALTSVAEHSICYIGIQSCKNAVRVIEHLLVVIFCQNVVNYGSINKLKLIIHTSKMLFTTSIVFMASQIN